MRLTLPGCPVPPHREWGLGLHCPIVSPTAKSSGFWTITRLPATGSNLFSPFVSHPGASTHTISAGPECLHCRNNTLTSTSMKGKARKPEEWDGSVPVTIPKYFVKWGNQGGRELYFLMILFEYTNSYIHICMQRHLCLACIEFYLTSIYMVMRHTNRDNHYSMTLTVKMNEWMK